MNFLIQDVLKKHFQSLNQGGVLCCPQVNEPWSVLNRINGKSTMFSATLSSREPDLQIYSIAQCAAPIRHGAIENTGAFSGAPAPA